MIPYFLDTNICSFYLNRKSRYHDQVVFHMDKREQTSLCIPIIVKAEMLFGLEKNGKKPENRIAVDDFLNSQLIVNLDDQALYHYAHIRAALERQGNIIGPNDLFIAAIVLAHNGTLVTHNTEEFSRIEGLKLEDWTE
jgi:tRNA(fMet)-specific endonuclease VapC